MKNPKIIFEELVNSEEYKSGIKWGKPRSGHEEGTIENHIFELESNLKLIEHNFNHIPFLCDYFKIMIHVHDTFKGVAEDVAIAHPKSHASLAAAFLGKLGAPNWLILCCQYHDEPHAIYRHGKLKNKRFVNLMSQLHDSGCLGFFMMFNAIDNITKAKGYRGFENFYKLVQNTYYDMYLNIPVNYKETIDELLNIRKEEFENVK